MKAIDKTLLYSAGLIASFGLGMWFYPAKSSSRGALSEPVETVAKAVSRVDQTASVAPVMAFSPTAPSTDMAHVYSLAANDLRAALAEAMKLPDATRLATLQNLMAIWLRTDRLAAAEWMTERRGLREFEPLSAQVSDAFFPDDTEMSAMFSFDLTDEKLRDVRVNKLVAYWKSGAHLKFDNSPWEVDGPGTGTAPAKTPMPDFPSADAETAAKTTMPVEAVVEPAETESKS